MIIILPPLFQSGSMEEKEESNFQGKETARFGGVMQHFFSCFFVAFAAAKRETIITQVLICMKKRLFCSPHEFSPSALGVVASTVNL